MGKFNKIVRYNSTEEMWKEDMNCLGVEHTKHNEVSMHKSRREMIVQIYHSECIIFHHDGVYVYIDHLNE